MDFGYKNNRKGGKLFVEQGVYIIYSRFVNFKGFVLNIVLYFNIYFQDN
jgi:hypothetical protein